MEVGQCVIETDARAATQLLDVIHGLELPYVLIFKQPRDGASNRCEQSERPS
jgi:hypothetical protein